MTTVDSEYEVRRFQNTNLEGNNNKYYQASYRRDGCGLYEVKFEWGRVGSGGQSKAFSGWTLTAIEAKITEKLRKGYQEIELHNPSAQAVAATSSGSSKVDELVSWMFREAGESISTYLSGRVDALSPNQLRKGRQQLPVIADLHAAYRSNPSGSNFSRLQAAVNEYYKAIPTKLPSRIKADELVADFCADLSLQETRLDQLEAALATMTAHSIGQYSALGAEIALLDRTDPKWNQLRAYVERGHHTHRFTCRVKDIFAVNIPSVRAAFEVNTRGKSQVMALFHGSRSGNWRHIMKTGLKLPSQLPGGVTNGTMFGPGLYFANQPTKSGQYCDRNGYQQVGRGVQYGLLISDVAVGNIYIARQADSSLRQAPRGYDSVQGKGGYTSGLVNDEYIVYQAEQHCPRFFVTWEAA